MLTRNIIKFAFMALYSVAFAEGYCRWLVPKIMIGPSFTVPHPDYGWTARKSFTGRRVTREFDMRFTTGPQAFRGGDYERGVPAEWTRIASFGNSQTFGVGDVRLIEDTTGKGHTTTYPDGLNITLQVTPPESAS